MGLQDDEEDGGNGRMYIGRSVNKFFKGYGFFRGEVISFNKSRKFFKIKYADGDREELDLSELKQILVDDNTNSVNGIPEPKGSSGRKRKRDQPVKNANGVENSPAPKSEDSVHGANFLASKVQLFAEKPGESSQPAMKTSVNGVEDGLIQIPEQVTPLVSDHPKAGEVLNANGIVQMDEKVDNCVDGRGTKRAVEIVAREEDTDIPPQKKRHLDASPSDLSGLESLSAPQTGEQHLLQGTSAIVSQNYKEVIKASVDTSGFTAQLPPLPTGAGSAVQVSQPGWSQISVREPLGQQTGSDQASVSTRQIAASPQLLTQNVSGYWASAQPPPGSCVTPDAKSSLAINSQKQAEPVAKDVYSLRALRAISRSLPVQRQATKSVATEQIESAHADPAPEPVVEPEPEPFVPLKQPLPPSSAGLGLGDLEHCIADLLQAYSFLRSFSHVLFISPFALEEFVAALSSEIVSPMIDCIHVSLLQALRRHLERLARSGSNSAVFCLRLSDWSLLDNITWPSYLMAYALTQGFLFGRGRSSNIGLVKKDYYKLPIDKKLAFLNFLCDKVLDTDELRTEIARRLALESESDFDSRACPSRPPDGSRRDNISLEGEFDEEFERMTWQKTDGITHKSGMQLLVQGKSLQAGEIKQPERGEDGNLDECALCGMDGVLICCDGCPAAYHSRCVGITKQGLPPGDWFCPECRADKLDSKGVKIPKGVRGGELLFLGPDGQRFFSSCGCLLVSEPSLEADSTHRYYRPQDLPVFLKYLEDAGRVYAPLQAAILRLCQPDLDPATTATVATVAPAKPPVPFSLECNKVDPQPDVPRLAGVPAATGGIAFSPEVMAVKEDAPVSAQQPDISPVEEKVLKDVPGSETVSEVVAEEKVLKEVSVSEAVTQVLAEEKVDKELLGSEALGQVVADQNLHPEVRGIDSASEVVAEEKVHEDVHGSEIVSQVVAEQSLDCAVGQPTDCSEVIGGAASLVDVRATDGVVYVQQTPPHLKSEACSQPATVVGPEVVEHNVQQKCEPPVSGNLTSVGLEMNAKPVPRHLDGNFSSVTQINASSYVNKYINGDIVFTAASHLAAMAGSLDDTPDDKGGSQKKNKPLTAVDQLKAFSQAAPTFFWPSVKKKQLEAPKEKCGWCINCRTTNRKGCLLTQVTGQISGGAAGVPGGIKPVKGGGGHYAAVAAYMLYMEEQLQGLLDGPWEAFGHRKLWRKRVEQGRSIEDVRRALLEMESSLRKIVLTSEWEKVVEDAPPLVSEYVISFVGAGASNSKKIVQKRRGRPPAVSKSPPVFAYDGACFGVKWFKGGPLSRQVYSWESLPRKVLRKAARQGGLKEIRDLICTKAADLPRKTLQCTWRARTEKVSSVAQLALQVRSLDKYIKWSEIKFPPEESSPLSGKASDDKNLSEAEILSKSEEEGVVKYLLRFSKNAEESNDLIQQQSDGSTKALVSSSGTFAGKGSPGGSKGGNEEWYLEKDLPLCLVKNFEHKRRKIELSKLQKAVKGRKGQAIALQKEPSFWDKITDPDRYELQMTPSSWICGVCSLSCGGSESLFCQRCTESFHISCTEIEETIDGRDRLVVCKNCAKLRQGQRNRRPSYKMRSMHHGEGSLLGTNGDGEDFYGTPKTLAKKKDKAPSSANQSTPVRELSLSGKRKAGKRNNGEDQTQLVADSNHLQPDESANAARSKPRRKSKSLQAVKESHASPDITPTERRTSSRIRNSLSPNKSTVVVMQDQSTKGKNRPSAKRKMMLRGDNSQADAEVSEDEFEFPQMEKRKSPQKRKRLKVLLQGLPLTGEDTDNNQLENDQNLGTQKRKKANNGLQYVQRKTKSDEDVARFRTEKVVFAGHVGIDPATGPRCSLCSEGYDPTYSFICCEWCQAWYHGDAVGLTQEDVTVLTGFKCHKCRKCRAPACPVSSTRQRRSTAKGRRRGVDHGEVIDADSANRSVQPSWRYSLEKDFIGFNDTTDFAAATNQAEEALAVDGSNFGHSLTGTVFELGGGLMTDLEHQIHLTTPLSSLGEHNVNLWASNSGSGQLDLPSGFSPPLDLAARGSASLSFTELLASEDDYLEGPGPGLPLGAAWAGNQAVSGVGVSSSTAWSGAAGVAVSEARVADLIGSIDSAGTGGVGPSFSLPGVATSAADLNGSSVMAGTVGIVPNGSPLGVEANSADLNGSSVMAGAVGMVPGVKAALPSEGVDSCRELLESVLDNENRVADWSDRRASALGTNVADLPDSVLDGMSAVAGWADRETPASVTNAASWDGQISDLVPTSTVLGETSLSGSHSFPVVDVQPAPVLEDSVGGAHNILRGTAVGKLCSCSSDCYSSVSDLEKSGGRVAQCRSCRYRFLFFPASGSNIPCREVPFLGVFYFPVPS
ncbi:hypothetical protein R1sor_013317 [Riccia sorocarpa]|uniref:Uncharacterized protein n=1 Tax=Riccia sorocarpa TaxID=122646 RepID=A0ABD3H6R3_9MARC